MLTEMESNKVIFGEFYRTYVFLRPVRCNHLIFILCIEGEVEVEINSYALEKYTPAMFEVNL